MKKQKTQSGITLIALVVTIVVLLILAGVTIVYVLQDGSIFESAKESAVETTVTSIADYAQQMQVEATTQYYVHNKEITIKNSPVGDDGALDIQSFFPESMKASVTNGSASTGLTSSNGKLQGEFTVIAGGHTCVMQFKTGVLYCSSVDSQTYSGVIADPKP